MKTLLSKLYSLVFCYLLLGVMFGSWNIVALSLDAKLLILITFIAHALGEFTANVVVEYRHSAMSTSNAKYWKDKELANRELASRIAAGPITPEDEHIPYIKDSITFRGKQE